MPASEYFQLIRNRVGPRTAKGQTRKDLEQLMQNLRSGKADQRLPLRRALEAEWRPGSVTEFLLLDQLVETMFQLTGIGEVRDAAIRMAMKDTVNLTRPEAIASALATSESGIAAVQRYERSLVRQQRQLMRDLRGLQEHRLLADEEEGWECEEASHPAAGGTRQPFTPPPIPVIERKIGKTNPILSQVVAATKVMDAAQWPTGPIPPMKLPNGEMFDEWNRPDRG